MDIDLKDWYLYRPYLEDPKHYALIQLAQWDWQKPIIICPRCIVGHCDYGAFTYWKPYIQA